MSKSNDWILTTVQRKIPLRRCYFDFQSQSDGEGSCAPSSTADEDFKWCICRHSGAPHTWLQNIPHVLHIWVHKYWTQPTKPILVTILSQPFPLVEVSSHDVSSTYTYTHSQRMITQGARFNCVPTLPPALNSAVPTFLYRPSIMSAISPPPLPPCLATAQL